MEETKKQPEIFMDEIKKALLTTGKNELTLTELYALFPHKNKDVVRGVINALTKKGDLIRPRVAVYCLRK